MAPTPSSASYAARVSALESHDIRTTADLIAARTRFERLDGMARTRGLAILERIRALRDAEICAVAALDAAQQELDACARRASLEHMQSGDRDPASIDACDAVRADVDRLERRLVFTRAALRDQYEELDRQVRCSAPRRSA